MAVPQRRTSKTRKRLRRTHFKLSAKGLVACPHCGEMIQPHKVCPFCGYYNGKLIAPKKVKKEEKKTENNPKKEVKSAKKESKEIKK